MYTLLRNLSTSNFVDLLNNQLVGLLNDDTAIDDDLHIRIECIPHFQINEFADGKVLYLLQRQFIFGLNKLHSHDDCTFYTNLIMYTKETMAHRKTEKDQCAIFKVPRGHYLFMWFNVLIGNVSQVNRGIPYYRTLPIAGGSFDPFALEALESIGCSPTRMKTAYSSFTTVNKGKRVSKMNDQDNNKRLTRGPPPT